MRKKDENKRKAIIEAAISEFAEYGYHQAKISRIAEMAGVAAGSTYSYFKNKEELLHYIFVDLWHRLQIKLAEIAGQDQLDPIAKLEAMLDALIDIFIANPEAGIVIINEINRLISEGKADFIEHYERAMDVVEQVIRAGIDNGLFDNSLDIRVFRYFLMGGARQLVHRWASNPDDPNLDSIRNGLKSMVKYGILARDDKGGA